jgi:hypothetical protein
MFHERSNGQLHIRVQRESPYLGMKLLKTVSLPDAAGVSCAHRAPDAAHFAGVDQLKGACMLRLTHLFFEFLRSAGRNVYFNMD